MKVNAKSRCYYMGDKKKGCDAYTDCEITVDFVENTLGKKCLVCGNVYDGGLEWYVSDT